MNIFSLIHRSRADCPIFWASEAQFHVVKPLGPEFYLGQAALGTFSGSSLKIGTPVSQLPLSFTTHWSFGFLNGLSPFRQTSHRPSSFST